jgi:hypothetical protein
VIESPKVTAAAAAAMTGKLVSACVGSKVPASTAVLHCSSHPYCVCCFLSCLQTLQAHLLMPYPSSSGSNSAASSTTDAAGAADAAAAAAGTGGQPPQAPMRSVYALAMSSAGTLVAAGTTESFIRLLDPRTGQKVMKLKVCCCFLFPLLSVEVPCFCSSGSALS